MPAWLPPYAGSSRLAIPYWWEQAAAFPVSGEHLSSLSNLPLLQGHSDSSLEASIDCHSQGLHRMPHYV